MLNYKKLQNFSGFLFSYQILISKNIFKMAEFDENDSQGRNPPKKYHQGNFLSNWTVC